MSIESGSRMILRSAHRVLPLRALASFSLGGTWCVPVISELSASPIRGELEVVAASGVVRAPAELVRVAGRMVARSVAGGSAEVVQRRAWFRVEVRLPLRAAMLTGTDLRDGEDVAGESVSLGGGGLAVNWRTRLHLTVGTRVYLELELPTGPLVPAVTTVVDARPGRARLSFTDIAPADVDRLMALVFRIQRRQLTDRRR